MGKHTLLHSSPLMTLKLQPFALNKYAGAYGRLLVKHIGPIKGLIILVMMPGERISNGYG